MREHGTRAKYVIEKCHCGACSEANRLYMRELTCVQLEERYGARPPRFVDAAEAREHLAVLSAAGIGRRQVSRISGVGDTALQKIKAGRSKRIHRETADAILSVTTTGHIAARSLVSASPARAIVAELLELGFTKTAIARALGYKTPALQIPGGERCTLRTMKRLQVLRQLALREVAS